MTNQLLVFAKNPIFGRVKTRLAATIGRKRALAVYQKLLIRTRDAVSSFASFTTIYFTDNIETEKEWTIFNQSLQQGNTLGCRMNTAFHNAFKLGKDKVIIIGTDCYDISPEIIQKAFDLLGTCDVVIGPAADGGYYLLGMRKLHEQFFQNKRWGTETVFLDTIEDIKKLGLTHKNLPTLIDIDIEEDLMKFKELLE